MNKDNQPQTSQEQGLWFIDSMKNGYSARAVGFDPGRLDKTVIVIDHSFYQSLQQKVAELEDKIYHLTRYLEQIEQDNERFREALEYYANEKNWYGIDKDRTDSIMKSDLEQLYGDTLHGGKRARQALNGEEK